MRARAHVCVHVCVPKSHCSSPQEATLLAKERELRENLRLERDKVSGRRAGLGWGGGLTYARMRMDYLQ